MNLICQVKTKLNLMKENLMRMKNKMSQLMIKVLFLNKNKMQNKKRLKIL